MSTTRRVFPEVFKREPVDRIISSGLSVGKVATELGLNETVLRRWVMRLGGQTTRPARRPLTQAPVASPSDLAPLAGPRPDLTMLIDELATGARRAALQTRGVGSGGQAGARLPHHPEERVVSADLSNPLGSTPPGGGTCAHAAHRPFNR